MRLIKRLVAGWQAFRAQEAKQPEAPAKQEPTTPRQAISDYLLARLNGMGEAERPRIPVCAPEVMPGVVPEQIKLAMDEAFAPLYTFANELFSGMGFMGYPFLAELTQRTEYRDISERVAAEMVRKWIKLKSRSKQNKAEQLKDTMAEMERLHVRDHLELCATYDGFFGRCQLYVDLGDLEAEELRLPLILSKHKIQQGALKGFKVIDPITTYPYTYNANNPLKPSYYRPSSWFVMSQQVHATRLLMFQSRPVPDLLKPAYNFGGISLSQLALPYVDNWLTTRDSISKITKNFSTSGILTNLDAVLQGGEGEEIIKRAKFFQQMRDNQGVLLLDKATEEFFQFNVSLNTLDKLQAQAQEHMAAVAKTPLIVLLGITPTGLNASSEGELRVFYDYVKEQQEKLFRQPLELIIRLIQLSLFGVIDEDITFDFEPLWQMDEEALARVRKSDGDAGAQYIANGVISPEEERKRLADDPTSGYEGLDMSAIIVPPANPAPTTGTASTDPLAPNPTAGDKQKQLRGVGRLQHEVQP